MRRVFLALVLLACIATTAFAHEVRPAYLELRERATDTYDVLWKVPAGGESLRLGIDVELPEGTTPLTARRITFANNAFTDRWSVRRPGGLSGGTIRITGLDATLTDALVRIVRANGSVQTVRLSPVTSSFVVDAVPRWWQAAATYLRLGFDHILRGVDHLLFVLGLLLIVTDRWMLLKTITAFTVAHSITLAIATLGYASAPLPPLNVAIALSILFLGPEIVRVRRGETSLTIRHPWVVAFAFGLLHGFGFASGLTALGLGRTDIPIALLSFNLGVELGQLFFVATILLLERSFRTLDIRWPRWAAALPSYTVGTLGAYWTLQRMVVLVQGMR